MVGKSLRLSEPEACGGSKHNLESAVSGSGDDDHACAAEAAEVDACGVGLAEHASGEVAHCDVAYSGVADYAVGVHGIAIGGNESAHTLSLIHI